jgi:hypothetical protein
MMYFLSDKFAGLSAGGFSAALCLLRPLNSLFVRHDTSFICVAGNNELLLSS